MSDDHDSEVLFKSAQRALRKRKFDESRTLFGQLLEIDSTSVKGHTGLATAAFLQQDYDAAVEHFKQVTRLNPMSGDAYINLGAVYNRTGNHQDAVASIRKGLQKNAKSSEGYYNLGIAYRKLGEPGMAVSAYKEAIRLNPEMAEAHQNLGNIHLEMGSFQQAKIDYEKALELRPDFAKAKAGLARVKEAEQAAHEQENPFGRLVDQKNLAPKAGPSTGRELSAAEQVKDRAELHTLALEIIDTAKQFASHLQDAIEPNVLSLNRSIAEGDTQRDLAGHHEDFQDSLKEYRDLRKQLRRKLLELRAHEELLHVADASDR